MSEQVIIDLAPEKLDEGGPEECAAFGLLTIKVRDTFITEGFDFFINSYRPGPLASGYHVAEWLAWNWWRLRWEPRSKTPDWWRAHRMNSIGEGYVWPNISIFSDGVRTALISEPSSRPDAKPFRYIGAQPHIIPSTLLEGAIDAFIPRVIARLGAQGCEGSNLQKLWEDILTERRTPDLALRRKLEALLGVDPDEGDQQTLEQLLADSRSLGKDAIAEVAADRGLGNAILSAAQISDIARSVGSECDGKDMVRLRSDWPRYAQGDVPAWLVGVRCAAALRQQEGFGENAIDDATLSNLIGVSGDILSRKHDNRSPFAFILGGHDGRGTIVLRSKWRTGRRFELARLLADHLIISGSGKLFPATRSYTFRQKAQRAFAAEFLAPFEIVTAMLDGDYSEENQQEVAEYFDVSPLTIRTLLVNHGKLERDELEEDFEAAA